MKKPRPRLRRITYTQIFLSEQYSASEQHSDLLLSEEVSWLLDQGFSHQAEEERTQPDPKWFLINYTFWVPDKVVTYLAMRWPTTCNTYHVD